MDIENTALDGVRILTPRKFQDDRGFFLETFRTSWLEDIDFAQDNHSYSTTKHTIRGLHFQRAPHGQTKLVRVIKGSILDVAVDIDPKSPSFKQHVSVMLSAENGKQLCIPSHMAHGFVTLEDDCEVLYKCSDYYAPDHEASIIWNDVDLAINWGTNSPILSAKDNIAPTLKEILA